MANPNLLFLGTPEDSPYLSKLKPCVGSANVTVRIAPVETLREIQQVCQQKDITGIITTSEVVLKKLLGAQYADKKPAIENYAGSYFNYLGLEWVILQPLKQIITVPYGRFLATRYISKLAAPKEWKSATDFKWTQLTPANAHGALSFLKECQYVAIDIETVRQDTRITYIGFCGIQISANNIITHCYVLPITSMFDVAQARQICDLPAAKIFQNGKYDLAYLARYNIICRNYFWDTAMLMHCWYSELPKDLAFLTTFCVREALYWKDLAQTQDMEEYMLYNAKDIWGTANSFLVLLRQMPKWALENYKLEFPLTFPCHLAELTGIKRNFTRLQAARTKYLAEIQEDKASLAKVTGVPNINANSPKQMKELLAILGCNDLPGTEEKNLKKAMGRHPINNLIFSKVLNIRGNRKLVGTYLRTDEDITGTSKQGAKEFNGRILFSLNPHGTDTGRLASSEHHFWCGVNIQNQPRGPSVKQTYEADPNFLWAEVDLEQAESRDTAYISGDENLIAAVESPRDFHSVNASAFFGVSYESIYDDVNKKSLNKDLRDLAKRVNHGANYNMGPGVLVDTMGLDAIYKAARVLKLSKLWSPEQVAKHLLACFHKTYPKIAGTYYTGVIKDVTFTNMLQGASGWTRYCFGKPAENKLHLNAYVAHCPQSLNAMTLNRAFMQVFYDLALHPEHKHNFRLIAQIHDSILFQFREGHEYLAEEVRKRMEIPITIKAYDGKERTFVVPAAIKAGKDGKGVKFWSDTE